MAGNSFGTLFRITSFGESHGKGIGVVVDGCPPGLEIDMAFLQSELDRRRPGQSRLVTQRKESDKAVILAGIYEGKTTGAPIAIWLENEDARPADYQEIASSFRPSHADYTYFKKYGIRDRSGGGRSSARETAARVAAGAVAKIFLENEGIRIRAFVCQVGPVRCPESLNELDLESAEFNSVRCPHASSAKSMEEFIETLKDEGDSTGGVIRCVINGCPPGLGEPVYDRLDADLSKAMMSINATKGFEIGSGFKGAEMRGSEHNDAFINVDSEIRTKTNFSGGMQGGITNGMNIDFRVAFKPTSTIGKKQETVNEQGEKVILEAKGRHDPCVVPRAVPIVESMAALVLADHFLRHRAPRGG